MNWGLVVLWLVAVVVEGASRVSVRDCAFEGDDGLFESGGCVYEPGQTGVVRAGVVKGMTGEVVVVTDMYLLYRVYLPLEDVLKNGMPVTDLFLYGERDGELTSIKADGEGSGKGFSGFGNGKGLSETEYVSFTYGGRSAEGIRRSLRDCFEVGAEYAYRALPNGECGLYHEPHPPISTCGTVKAGETRKVKLRDVEHAVLHSAIKPDIEFDRLVYQEMPRYEGCDTGYVDYEVGDILEVYGNEMFTYRRIDYEDIPAEGVVHVSPLDKREDALYFHTYAQISKWHGRDREREMDAMVYLIDVEEVAKRFPDAY